MYENGNRYTIVNVLPFFALHVGEVSHLTEVNTQVMYVTRFNGKMGVTKNLPFHVLQE